MRGRALVLSIVAAVVVIVAGGLGGYFLGTDVTYKTVPRVPPVEASMSAEVPPASQPAAPSPPSLRHDPVAQAMPTKLTVWQEGQPKLMDGQAIDPNPAVANEAGVVMPNTLELPAVQNDPRLDWAVLPGTNVGTTVILCHTLADAKPPLPCNPLGVIPLDSDTSSGYRAELELPTGRLTAELVHVWHIPKTASKEWDVLFAKTPERWLVGMCRLTHDPTTGQLENTYDFVFLEFRLIESVSYS